MKVQFIYPAFERHAQAHPELKQYVPCNEYIGSPSLGIASVAACTPPGHEVAFVDDRIHPVQDNLPDADLYALSFFTAAATRAIEIGDMLRSMGKRVVAGGIFPTMMSDACTGHFDSVLQGEGEVYWEQVIADAQKDDLKPVYKALKPADLSSLPRPAVELYLEAEDDLFSPDDYPLQLSRGCPFKCDSCVLPSCMGKKIRHFPQDTVWETLQVFARAHKRCSLTEDTSFLPIPGVKRRFRDLLRRIMDYRQDEPVELSYVGTSMPLLLNMETEIFDEVRQAGIGRFYLVGGFDPVTRGAFGPGDKAMWEKAAKCVKLCQDHGVEPYVSFLVGNEQDDEGTFDRMLEFSNQMKLNIAEFAIATPYPGSPMWKKMTQQDRIFDHTWKHYNDANVVFKPANMSPERLQEGYLYLWREFYRSRQDLKQQDANLATVQF